MVRRDAMRCDWCVAGVGPLTRKILPSQRFLQSQSRTASHGPGANSQSAALMRPRGTRKSSHGRCELPSGGMSTPEPGRSPLWTRIWLLNPLAVEPVLLALLLGSTGQTTSGKALESAPRPNLRGGNGCAARGRGASSPAADAPPFPPPRPSSSSLTERHERDPQRRECFWIDRREVGRHRRGHLSSATEREGQRQRAESWLSGWRAERV